MPCKHWSHDGQYLKIFDVYSCVHEDELYVGTSRECLTRVMSRDTASSALSGRLTFLDSGFGKKTRRVIYVQINEYMGHLLFHEGKLNLDILTAADEDDNNIFIPMTVNDTPRIISIRNDLPQNIVCFNSNGKPLKIF